MEGCTREHDYRFPDHLADGGLPGPPDPHATWFIDNEPDAGILGIFA